jgi:hypothetical protein
MPAFENLIENLLQLRTAALGPTLPTGNVRYHGEYWGQSGREIRLSMSQLLGPDCRSTPSNLI